MLKRAIIIFTFLLLFTLGWLAFVKPVLTGRAVVEQTARVVVILKPEPSPGLITGGVVLDGAGKSAEDIEQLKQVVGEVQQEVLGDVNRPSFWERITGSEVVDFKVEIVPEVLPVLVGEATPDGIAELQSHPLVQAVYPDIEFELLLSDSVPQINADDVWAITVNGTVLDGSGSTVCVIDTGIDSSHPAFAGRIKAEHCYCSNNCCPNGQREDTKANDTNSISHGTHVSGIIASNGTYKGVAPGASIVAVKVCQSSCAMSDILAGLDFCVARKQEFGIDVISGSIGDGGNYRNLNECPGYFDSALQIAWNVGIVPVFASGNNGYTQGISYPACSPWAVSVGAVNKSDSIASFTNRGQLLDLLAPGVGIVSTKIGGVYGSLSGTSQATPHVSGVIALVKQYARLVNLTLTPGQVLQLLKSTGVLIQSWPRVDALAAINALMSSYPPPQNTPPVVSILSPVNGSRLYSPLTLVGSAFDAEDGNLTNLTWTSSINGLLGSGNSIVVNLSVGNHTITLEAFDSLGARGSDSIVIEVLSRPPANNPPFVEILSPQNGSLVNAPVNLAAIATDPEDGVLVGKWFEGSSLLGVGNEVVVALSPGSHNISFVATDSQNSSSVAEVFFTSRTCQLSLDQNSNGGVDIGDVVVLLTGFAAESLPCNTLLSMPFCVVELDFNRNAGVDIGDFVLLLTGLVNENIYNIGGESCFALGG